MVADKPLICSSTPAADSNKHYSANLDIGYVGKSNRVDESNFTLNNPWDFVTVNSGNVSNRPGDCSSVHVNEISYEGEVDSGECHQKNTKVTDKHNVNQPDTSILVSDALYGLAQRLGNRNQLPNMMPEKFNGDLLSCPSWNHSFESIIEQNAASVSQRLFFLGKCTTGEAHTAIQVFLSIDTEDAYKKARATLHKRYGDK